METRIYSRLKDQIPPKLIAQEFGLTLSTVRVHKSAIIKKGWTFLPSAEGHVTRQYLDSCALTDAQSGILHARYILGATFPGIASRSGLSLQTVYNHASAGLKRLGVSSASKAQQKRAVLVAFGIIAPPKQNPMDDPMF